MIVSHKHKFIFIKPYKVAGTSVEINLAKHCGPRDIVTTVAPYRPSVDGTPYNHDPQNNFGYYEHVNVQAAKLRLPKKIWESYFKFSVVRSTWQVAVSFYYNKKHAYESGRASLNPFKKSIFEPFFYCSDFLLQGQFFPRLKYKRITYKVLDDFKDFTRTYPFFLSNDQFYFDKNGEFALDHCIKFKNLKEGYKKICQKLDIPYEKLPRTKTEMRNRKKSLTEHYGQKSRKRVRKQFKKTVDYFGYKFPGSGK